MSDVVQNIGQVVKTSIGNGISIIGDIAQEYVDIFIKEIQRQKIENKQKDDGCETAKITIDKVTAAAPSNFQLIYTSKDGRYCLFETKEGNLISADASKFV